MTNRDGRRIRRWAGALLAATLSVTLDSSEAASVQSRRQTIQHLTPARDSVGPAPARFAWSAIKEAESYSIGVWNEVDVLLWRQNNIKDTSIARPEDFRLEPGTYMWSVSALRQGEEIADSGLAAFVVRTAP